MNLDALISKAATIRNEAVAKASREAPDYPTFDAAAQAAEMAYRRTVRRAYSRKA